MAGARVVRDSHAIATLIVVRLQITRRHAACTQRCDFVPQRRLHRAQRIRAVERAARVHCDLRTVVGCVGKTGLGRRAVFHQQSRTFDPVFLRRVRCLRYLARAGREFTHNDYGDNHEPFAVDGTNDDANGVRTRWS